ncbi:MAG: TPM domain-containing protein [Ruminococcaceae bacterium]|nr:TPM domain-containing protein [Oscillospiraceae bacterium]
MRRDGMKKIIFSLTCLALFFCLTISAIAEMQYLVDSEGILTASQAQQIGSELLEMSEKHGMDFVIVTSENFDGKSSQDFADDFFDYGGYREDGIILVMSHNIGDVFISTTGDGIAVFSDSDVDDIFDVILPYMADGKYAESFSLFLSECERLVYEYENAPKKPFLSAKQITICVIIGIIIGFIGVSVMKSGMKTVRFKPNAKDYMVFGSLKLTEKNDTFLYRNVNRVRRETNSGSGGNRIGSSGRSHGGSGRSFR